MFPGF